MRKQKIETLVDSAWADIVKLVSEQYKATGVAHRVVDVERPFTSPTGALRLGATDETHGKSQYRVATVVRFLTLDRSIAVPPNELQGFIEGAAGGQPLKEAIENEVSEFLQDRDSLVVGASGVPDGAFTPLKGSAADDQPREVSSSELVKMVIDHLDDVDPRRDRTWTVLADARLLAAPAGEASLRQGLKAKDISAEPVHDFGHDLLIVPRKARDIEFYATSAELQVDWHAEAGGGMTLQLSECFTLRINNPKAIGYLRAKS